MGFRRFRLVGGSGLGDAEPRRFAEPRRCPRVRLPRLAGFRRPRRPGRRSSPSRPRLARFRSRRGPGRRSSPVSGVTELCASPSCPPRRSPVADPRRTVRASEPRRFGSRRGPGLRLPYRRAVRVSPLSGFRCPRGHGRRSSPVPYLAGFRALPLSGFPPRRAVRALPVRGFRVSPLSGLGVTGPSRGVFVVANSPRFSPRFLRSLIPNRTIGRADL